MAEFFVEFRNDHRFVLRTLVDLRKAVEARDFASARQLVEALDTAAGPHMEFEERYLYRHSSRFWEKNGSNRSLATTKAQRKCSLKRSKF